MTAKPDDVDLRVRRRLRELRTQQKLTLRGRGLARPDRRLDAEPLESGKRRLALDHLPRLAAALAVSTDDLLREPEQRDPACAEPADP